MTLLMGLMAATCAVLVLTKLLLSARLLSLRFSARLGEKNFPQAGRTYSEFIWNSSP
jgi:hypothetical protein